MHRQSLGSPGSRSGAGAGGATEPARPAKLRQSATASRSSRAFVHAIPIATLLCFLVLYLLSHDPALDSAAGNGGAVPTKKAVSGVNIGRYIGGGGGGVSAVRGLMEERRLRHRKDLSAPTRHVRSS